jgi:hypothetical protein
MRIQFKQWMTPAAVGVVSFAAGVGTGYFVTRQRYLSRVNNLESEVVGTKDWVGEVEIQMTNLEGKIEDFMRGVVESYKEDVTNALSAIQHDASPQLTTNPGGKSKPTVKAQPKPKEKVVEVVDVEDTFPVSEDEDWNWEEELKHRTQEAPYILHRDEFFSNENEYRQCSLSYYRGDNILCDEHDVPVYNPERVVGNLAFGHGSADPSIVYVRNDRLLAEYEVILDEGFYQTEVLGHEIEDGLGEVKHSIQRFRASD